MNKLLGAYMESNLVQKSWLKRVIKIPEIDETITYSGRGIGTEKCVVSGEEFISQSTFGWFVPEFDFNYNNMSFNVQARVWPWPWLGLRSLVVSLDGKRIYSEGGEPYKVTRFTETFHLVLWFTLTFAPFLVLAKVL